MPSARNGFLCSPASPTSAQPRSVQLREKSSRSESERHQLFDFAASALGGDLDEILAGRNRRETHIDLMRAAGRPRRNLHVRHLASTTVQQYCADVWFLAARTVRIEANQQPLGS